MLLLKLPVPVPFEVLLFAVVGLPEVFQHTPRAVTLAPPSFVIVPPLLAEFVVIDVTAEVVRIGFNLVFSESFEQFNTNNMKINIKNWKNLVILMTSPPCLIKIMLDRILSL